MSQHDDHVWLTVSGEGWAIRKMRWPIVWLWRGYEPSLEYLSVDLSEFDADGYCDKAIELLKEGDENLADHHAGGADLR